MPATQYKQVRDFVDKVMRDSLCHPENLRGLLSRAVPDLADRFDCHKRVILQRDFLLEDWREREADLPFEIPFHSEEGILAALVMVLIEHQSDTDALMPLRLLTFLVAYWNRQWEAWMSKPPPRPPLQLTPVLPIVFYTGQTPWGSNQTIVDLLGEPQRFHPFAPQWKPIFWNLADDSPEALLSSDNAWLQMLSVIRAEMEETESFAKIFADCIDRLQKVYSEDRVRWQKLMEITLAWTLWRRPTSEKDMLWNIAKEHQTNTRRVREIEKMASKLGPSFTDVAEMRGEERGEERGKLRANRETLKILLKDRFGRLPAKWVKRIDKVEDAETLQQAIRQVYKVEKLDDIQL